MRRDKELASFPGPVLRLLRGHFLAGLLAAPSIYRTPALRYRFESTARSNIEALPRSPRYRLYRGAPIRLVLRAVSWRRAGSR